MKYGLGLAVASLSVGIGLIFLGLLLLCPIVPLSPSKADLRGGLCGECRVPSTCIQCKPLTPSSSYWVPATPRHICRASNEGDPIGCSYGTPKKCSDYYRYYTSSNNCTGDFEVVPTASYQPNANPNSNTDCH